MLSTIENIDNLSSTSIVELQTLVNPSQECITVLKAIAMF